MNAIFKPFLQKFVLVFFKDILVYSGTTEEHVLHLAAVLDTLKKHSLVVNRKKCEFGSERIEYLGHMSQPRDLRADGEKIQTVIDSKEPKNLKEHRGSWPHRILSQFCANYAQIAQPLTNQLKNDQFGWSLEATQAFETLKQAMVISPVLAMPTFKLPFIVETDASGYGVGAVLMQEKRPVAFFSKLLGPRARQKAIYEKELIEICLAVLKWKSYLLGCHFSFTRTNRA